jgi:hypothetical protein
MSKSLQVRQKHYALLLVWIGTGDHGQAVFGRARVVGQVWHICGSRRSLRPHLYVVLELLSIPHA